MANLVESDASFPATTTSIIVTDAVVGAPVAGPFNNGIANGPHVSLANRTQWLNTNKASLAGGNTFTGKQIINDVRAQKYILNNQWTDAGDSATELTHVSSRFFSQEPWAGAAGKQKDFFTFPAQTVSGKLCHIRAHIMTREGQITDPLLSIIDTSVLLPIDGSGDKVFIIGARVGDSQGTGEVAVNNTAQNNDTGMPMNTGKTATGGLHLLQYDNGLDDQFDVTGTPYEFNGMIILKEDRIAFRHISTFAGTDLKNVHINLNVWGLNV